MAGGANRDRAVLLLAVAVAALAAVALALLVVDEARIRASPALSIAVFGTFLTSMAIITAFSIEQGSRWPTPWEALERAHVPAWFVVALGSVVVALLASATDSRFLSAFSLTLALTAVPLGAWGLWRLISLSSDQGRWRLVVDLLARSILAVDPVEDATAPDLGEFVTEDHVPDGFLNGGVPRRPQRTGVGIELVPGVLREYADRRALEAIVRLIDEVHAAACVALERAGSVDFEQYLRSVDTLLYVQRLTYVELGTRVLSGQLGDATARIALPRAGQVVLDTAGRARGVAGRPPWDRRRVEVLAARHLTALCRFAGEVAQEADERLWRSPGPRGGGVEEGEQEGVLRALSSAGRALQQSVRWAVDPDPPGAKVPPDHVWSTGLEDPESALVWLWSTVESGSGPFGVGLYALCWILTGRKFRGSYWDGVDVLTEISRRLRLGGAGTEAGRAAVERAGGLERIALELGARRLAATPARSAGPAAEEDPRGRDDRHAACELFLAAAGFKPGGRDPVADLAWLLTDRLDGSLWTMVHRQLSQLPDAALRPPLRPVHRCPEACALAVCLRLAPLEDDPDPVALAALEEFARRLPDPLLKRTASLGLALTAADGERLSGGRESWQRTLIEAARFARHVTPAPLLSREVPGVAEPSSAAPLPAPLAGSDFDGAIAAIRAASSPLAVDLVQHDDRWLEQWSGPRAELDAALLAGALRGELRVRRVRPFDLGRDADPRSTRLHYRWNNSLDDAMACFPAPRAGEAHRYGVRLAVGSGLGDGTDTLRDAISIRAEGEDGPAWFEQLWSDRDPDHGSTIRPGLVGP